jgi:hypothetical protein
MNTTSRFDNPILFLDLPGAYRIDTSSAGPDSKTRLRNTGCHRIDGIKRHHFKTVVPRGAVGIEFYLVLPAGHQYLPPLVWSPPFDSKNQFVQTRHKIPGSPIDAHAL